jgi:hypothetical protein
MRSLRALIGADCIERLWITSRREAWLDENGSAAGNPVNQAATFVGHSYGWQFSLRGAVVIVGLDKTGDTPVAPSPDKVDATLKKITAR